MSAAGYDRGEARAFLDVLFTDAPGLAQVVTLGGGTPRWAQGADLDALADWGAEHDHAPQGVYVRMTPLAHRPERGRGGAELAGALVTLWADLDYGTEGHKPPPGGLPNPATGDDAAALVAHLPTPSLWVHSGGGLYPLWVLDAPFILDTDEDRARAAHLSEGWQESIGRAAEHLGVNYGTGVGDLARVLRLPGSHNWKTGHPRPCRITRPDSGLRYALADLESALTATMPPEPPRGTSSAPSASDRSGTAYTGPGPLDLVAEHADWLDVLPPDWTEVRASGDDVARAFRRPGATSPDSAHVLRDQPHVLIVWSEDAGMPTGPGNRLTKGRVYAHTWHGGDTSAAARGILDGTSQGLYRLPAACRPAATPLRPAPALGTTPGPLGDATRALVAADDAPPAPDGAGDLYRWQVTQRAQQLRVERDARALVAADDAPPAEPFDLGTIGDVLARPPEPAARIDRLAPWDGSVLIVAQRKTGKTTLTLNLARCLITGTPFLGEYAVRAVTGRVAVLNFEVSGAQLARWANDAGVPEDRCILVNLRGRRNPFKHPEDLARLGAELRARDVETLIVDPFGRAYPGTSQNDAGEVQSFLVALDEFARAEVGALDVFLTAHAGWNGERTRGSSALEDWPDAIWTLTRDADEDGTDSGDRYLRAEGRDVDVPESRLIFAPEDRHLTITGGSRKQNREDRKRDALADHVATYVTGHPGESISAMEKALREGGVSFQRGDVSKAATVAAGRGRVVIAPGARGAKLLYPATYPDIPRHTPVG